MNNPELIEPSLPDAATASAATPQVSQKHSRHTQDLTPGAVPQASVRRDLVLQIQELENTCQYMGDSHPRRQGVVTRLHQLKILLGRWDQTLQLGRDLTKLNAR